jgi:hypothetical protein
VSCGCEGVVELTLSLLWLRTSEASVDAENTAVRLVGAGGHLRADLRRASYRRARLSRRALCDHGLLTSDGRIPRTSGYSASRAENDENPVSAEPIKGRAGIAHARDTRIVQDVGAAIAEQAARRVVLDVGKLRHVVGTRNV